VSQNAHYHYRSHISVQHSHQKNHSYFLAYDDDVMMMMMTTTTTMMKTMTTMKMMMTLMTMIHVNFFFFWQWLKWVMKHFRYLQH